MSRERLEHYLEAIDESPPGRDRNGLLELAINEADTLGDAECGFDLRMQLIETCFFDGTSDRGIAAFAWCLKHCDRNPRPNLTYTILWRYKWVLIALQWLPQISIAKILEMIDDMGERATKAGYGPRPVHYLRWNTLTEAGDFEAAAKEMKLWRSAKKDGLQDCAACEMNSEVEYLSRRQFDEQTLECAEPILRGRFSCAEVPELTLGHLIRPLMRLGRFEEAEKHAVRGYRMVTKNEDYILPISQYLLLATATNEWSRAVRIFTRHAEWSLITGMIGRRFYFNAAAAAFLEKLANEKRVPVEMIDAADDAPKKRRSHRRLRLTANHPCYRPDDRYDIGQLAEWYRHEAHQLAAQFNQRNGNTHYSEWIEETRQLAGLRP